MQWLISIQVGLFGLSLARWFGFAGWYPTLAATFAIVAGLGYLGTCVAARLIGPTEIRFGTVVTFRDLAEVIGADGVGELGAQPVGSRDDSGVTGG